MQRNLDRFSLKPNSKNSSKIECPVNCIKVNRAYDGLHGGAELYSIQGNQTTWEEQFDRLNVVVVAAWSHIGWSLLKVVG